MTTIALVVALTALGWLAVLQVLLIAGLPLGSLGWGGQHRVLPTRLRIASGTSIVLHALFATLLLSRAGVLPGSTTTPVTVATWVLFGYLALSIVPNAISRSRAERLVQTPVSVLLALATLTLALHG